MSFILSKKSFSRIYLSSEENDKAKNPWKALGRASWCNAAPCPCCRKYWPTVSAPWQTWFPDATTARNWPSLACEIRTWASWWASPWRQCGRPSRAAAWTGRCACTGTRTGRIPATAARIAWLGSADPPSGPALSASRERYPPGHLRSPRSRCFPCGEFHYGPLAFCRTALFDLCAWEVFGGSVSGGLWRQFLAKNGRCDGFNSNNIDQSTTSA